MLIESFALDTVWSLASVITYALASEGHPDSISTLFNNTSDQVTVSHQHAFRSYLPLKQFLSAFAFLLMTYRVLLGRAWTSETERQLSTIRCNQDGPDDLERLQQTIGREQRDHL
jgi:hypothetical protein